MEFANKKLIPLKKQKVLLFIPFISGLIIVFAAINYTRLKHFLPLIITLVAYVIVSGGIGILGLCLISRFEFQVAVMILMLTIAGIVYLFAIISFFYQKYLFKNLKD